MKKEYNLTSVSYFIFIMKIENFIIRKRKKLRNIGKKIICKVTILSLCSVLYMHRVNRFSWENVVNKKLKYPSKIQIDY